MKNWYLVIVFLIGSLYDVDATDTEVAQPAQIEIEIGPDDDDEDYYEDDDGPEVWIGPGLYYGVWFDDEYEYHRWYRDRYYHRYHHDDGHDHHDHERGHGGGHHH
jgi:hypothetical protein